MDLPVRKHVRLKEYDYSRNGAYFVTVCAAGRACIFSDVLHPVGPDALIGPAGQKSAGFYFTVQLAGRNSSLNFSRANTSVMPAM